MKFPKITVRLWKALLIKRILWYSIEQVIDRWFTLIRIIEVIKLIGKWKLLFRGDRGDSGDALDENTVNHSKPFRCRQNLWLLWISLLTFQWKMVKRQRLDEYNGKERRYLVNSLSIWTTTNIILELGNLRIIF